MLSILTSDLSTQEKFIIIVAFLGAAMLAIITHEYAHGYAAMKNGDLTPKLSGRMTLNPRAHFDWFGLLMFLTVGIGWAKPVPINPDNFEHKKKGVFQTAIAGVTANFILAFIAFGLLVGFNALSQKIDISSEFVYILLMLVIYFLFFSASINISLIAFNLLPVYPLDGFRVCEAFLKPTNGYLKFMYRYGNFVLIGLLVLSYFLPKQYSPLDIYLNAVRGFIEKLLTLIFGEGVGLWI